eukprot:6162754-Amphidinium_carterae.1
MVESCWRNKSRFCPAILYLLLASSGGSLRANGGIRHSRLGPSKKTVKACLFCHFTPDWRVSIHIYTTKEQAGLPVANESEP